LEVPPKKGRKEQENGSFSLPLLGKRMIPHGERGRNSDEETFGLLRWVRPSLAWQPRFLILPDTEGMAGYKDTQHGPP
jgi:hypothetical protein